MAVERPKCETCIHWIQMATTGNCHRFPPASIHGESWHVVTDATDFCGEHPDFPAYIASTKEAKP